MKKIYILFVTLISTFAVQAQVSFGNMQNQISRGKDGINVFDVQKDNREFKGLSIDLGGAFNMDFQATNSFNDQPNNITTTTGTTTRSITGYRLMNTENNFTLPAADMYLGAQLFDGVRVNLDVYLASRHHNESYVKGGYLQIDKLDFIKKDFLADFMKYATIKIGQMENNFGDAHFRGSDNGNTIKNAFVGNNIMYSFTTEMGMEVYYNRSGLVSMLGVTNGNLNQSNEEVFYPNGPNANTTHSPSILAKLGFDKQLNEDLRVRLTGSYYHNANLGNANIYSANRSGFGYWGILNNNAYKNTITKTDANGDTTTTPIDVPASFNKKSTPEATFNPNFGNWATTYMINPFVKYKGLEFFGTIELASGGDKVGSDDKRTANQYASELIYRFGGTEQFYIGGKYNTVSGKLSNADAKKVTVDKFEASAGWFMTKNILAKLNYVNQKYKDYSQFTGDPATGNLNNFYGGKFEGLVFEATIAF
ncbi:hypothetical protein [Flavobacterium nitrogenifigens]|uniref:Porin n=1 Tax=Flavobacterium nitrogenifigens TaxID=1617283 RepID=A0A521EZW0_9FLAO|nr:hypothetical protein [Flavobacterium nitrogenifigens]KAF2333287.1 hypothetical protein DM397_09060 [Flavobacterium nitrogenifigens]SMO88720.1 hypothetical protein SAMN06265220_105243 [Flavobacterium nitrogenifigens]